MVKVSHDKFTVTTGPFSLEGARKSAKELNTYWVKYWHDHYTGSRPTVDIWEKIETISGKVEGVDPWQK